MRLLKLLRWTAAFAALGSASSALAGEALIAAASNFSTALEQIEAEFEKTSGHQLRVSLGSTGKLYAQIVNGAPFDVFLSADQDRAAKLEQTGAASEGQRFTYATGRLVFWYPSGKAGPEILKSGSLRNLAVAHSALAPYGKAAMDTLKSLYAEKQWKGKLVIGENIGQTFAFVGSGNAEAGFVAAAQLIGRDIASETIWQVPQEMHTPIRQDAVLLKRGETNSAAIAFFEFLKSGRARTIIRAAGYALD